MNIGVYWVKVCDRYTLHVYLGIYVRMFQLHYFDTFVCGKDNLNSYAVWVSWSIPILHNRYIHITICSVSCFHPYYVGNLIFLSETIFLSIEKSTYQKTQRTTKIVKKWNIKKLKNRKFLQTFLMYRYVLRRIHYYLYKITLDICFQHNII